MNSPFSRDSKVTPFQHPLAADWPNALCVQQIYAEERDGSVEILEQWYARGDAIGKPASKLETLQPQAGPMMVWSIQLSTNYRHGCIVFAPKGFAIKKFRHDLALLFMLGQLGDLCERRAFLGNWQTLAGILTGNDTCDMAQGWWHKNARVVVVGCMNEGHDKLSDALIKLIGKTWSDAITLERDPSLSDRVFRKATKLMLQEMKRHPRTA
ncbi:MAG: hypothetical protein Q8L52_00185 [bacterium]|nr:hypothetical protein [bacterium]